VLVASVGVSIMAGVYGRLLHSAVLLGGELHLLIVFDVRVFIRPVLLEHLLHVLDTYLYVPQWQLSRPFIPLLALVPVVLY